MLELVTTHRELVRNLVQRELKSRYKGSFLGFAWSVISPLILALIYVVFMTKLVAKGYATPEDIIVGVFAWQFTAVCINSGMMCISGNANLIKKVSFPREAIPVSVVLSGLVDYLFMLAMELVIFVVWFHFDSSGSKAIAWSHLPLLVPVLILHTIFNLAIALILSALNVYYRDTQHLVSVGTTAFFFLSPAMYSLTLISEGFPKLLGPYVLNPLAPIFTGYRTALLGQEFPMSWWMAGGIFLALASFAFGLWFFRRMQRNFADFV